MIARSKIILQDHALNGTAWRLGIKQDRKTRSRYLRLPQRLYFKTCTGGGSFISNVFAVPPIAEEMLAARDPQVVSSSRLYLGANPDPILKPHPWATAPPMKTYDSTPFISTPLDKNHSQWKFNRKMKIMSWSIKYPFHPMKISDSSASYNADTMR